MISAYFVGGAVVRRYWSLSVERADLDLAVDVSQIDEAVRVLETAGYELVPAVDTEGDVSNGDHRLRGSRSPAALRRLCFAGRKSGVVDLKWIDLIPVEPVEGSLAVGVLSTLLPRFDITLCRVAQPAVITLYGPMLVPSPKEHLTGTYEGVRDLWWKDVRIDTTVPWQRPHREAKYRRLLGLGPKPGEVLPLILPPHEVQARRKAGLPFPEGFRPLTPEEIAQVRACPREVLD